MSGANKVTSHCQFARAPSAPGGGDQAPGWGSAGHLATVFVSCYGRGRSGRGLDTNSFTTLLALYKHGMTGCLQGFYEQPRHLASRPQ